ncbi:pyridoxal phosphate-dependent decarboxylase family protein [Gordonia jinghuaiqii]|uniref:pyridoxal phosphate-dependent decarboxylase family protein n=1 Tax=Gordonia jinghuaiqii TaxID=2758710 RepID=UPI001CB77AC2
MTRRSSRPTASEATEGNSVIEDRQSTWGASRFARPGGGWADVGRGLAEAAAAVTEHHHGAPLPPGDPVAVLAAVTALLGPHGVPESGIGESEALTRLAHLVAEYGLDLTHPMAAAHLQPAPLSVAVAADALASATNASLDTYDSGPATLALETWTVQSLARMAGFGERAGGVFSPGGSISNLLALMIARDHTAARRGIDVRHDGVGALRRPVVFCSRVAHFSVHRACAALGLGESAVIPVDVDSQHRMIPEALEAAIRDAGAATPLAIVATAGTTDFGTVDPLPEIADIAERHEIWLHVDAAYGFGALFSDRLAGLLTGIDRADSVTLDLHKVGWQPAAASVMLLSDANRFVSLNRSVAYLNPDDDVEAGYNGLLGQTLQTTRRPDVLKVAATLLAYGRNTLGEMLEQCNDLAVYAEQRIATELQLELIAPVSLTTIVFRYRCADLDAVNGELRRRLITDGKALIGRTQVRVPGEDEPQTCLKLTLLNPETSESDIDELFDELLRVALEVESEGTATQGDTVQREEMLREEMMRVPE